VHIGREAPHNFPFSPRGKRWPEGPEEGGGLKKSDKRIEIRVKSGMTSFFEVFAGRLVFEAAAPLSPTLPREGGGGFLRRCAPEFYDSGFRIESGMTRRFFDCGLFFASPDTPLQPAAKNKGE
jgi:hypothetical protein